MIGNSLLKSQKAVRKPSENQNSTETDRHYSKSGSAEPVIHGKVNKNSQEIEPEKTQRKISEVVPEVESKTTVEEENPNSSATHKKVSSEAIDIPIYESKPTDED